MTDKPAPPDSPFDPFPRIPVDESEGTPFDRIRRIAAFAADDWVLGPEGPYKNPDMSGAQRSQGSISEALLHLLELGVIDIDVERLEAMKWTPMNRERHVTS